jgi:hypothetical protein
MNIHQKLEAVTDKLFSIPNKKMHPTQELVYEPYVYFVPSDKTEKNSGGTLLT